MTLPELQSILDDEGFPGGTYDLKGGALDFGLSLKYENDGWAITYFEKGKPHFLARFSGQDAFEYFLKKMRELFPGAESRTGHA